MVGVIKGNTDASYDANGREREREMHDRKKRKKEVNSGKKKYTYGGGHDDLLSSVIGKIWMHQGAFCRDPLGTVVCERLLKGKRGKAKFSYGRGIKKKN